MPTAKYFDIPFATSGDRAAVPDSSQPNGSVNMDEGWPINYELEQGVAPAALDISRQQANQLSFDMTGAIGEIQERGIATWDSEVDYPLNALVMGSQGVFYKARVASGPNNGGSVEPITDPDQVWLVTRGDIVHYSDHIDFLNSFFPGDYVKGSDFNLYKSLILNGVTGVFDPVRDTSGHWAKVGKETTTRLDGLRSTWDSDVLMTLLPGKVRNQNDRVDLFMTASLQKNITLTWSLTTGGLPAALTLAPDTQYRRFLVSTPEGVENWAFDTSSSAANFFLDAAAIAAGFTDPLLFRQVGWAVTDATSKLKKVFQSVADPSLYTFASQIQVVDQPNVLDTAREAFDLSAAIPPNTIARVNLFVDMNTNDDLLLITTNEQTDISPSESAFTVKVRGTPRIANIIAESWVVDSSSQIFARRTGANFNNIKIHAFGWQDLGNY